jgi:hypothetical protein
MWKVCYGEFGSGLLLGVQGVGAIWFLWGCQRFCWERWCGRHSDGCRLRTQCECRIFQLYLDVLLSCGDVTPAWCCWWGQRNAPFHRGVVRNWKFGYCCGKLSCVHCNVRRSVFWSVPHRLCCNLGTLICRLPIMKTCQGLGFFAWAGFVWCYKFGMLFKICVSECIGM